MISLLDLEFTSLWIYRLVVFLDWYSIHNIHLSMHCWSRSCCCNLYLQREGSLFCKNPLGVNCAGKTWATQITFDWLIDWLTRCDRRSSTTIHTALGRLQNIWCARQLCGSVWNNWSPPVPAKGIKWRAPPVFLRETVGFWNVFIYFSNSPTILINIWVLQSVGTGPTNICCWGEKPPQ